MISRLLLPSAVRLATYACVRGSRRIRARQIMYSARLASLLPARLRGCLTTLPEEASMGATPHRLAKEASLPNLWGLSPATIKSVAALSVPMPAKRPTPGRPAPPAGRGAPLARRSPSRGPRSGGPPNGARPWWPRARHEGDRKSTRLNSSHANISYAVVCLKKKNNTTHTEQETKKTRNLQSPTYHNSKQ